jgi:selenium metabolism protein YedF
MVIEKNEINIDVRNLACPEPVVRVKNALSSEKVSTVTVTTNEMLSVENIKRFAQKMGYSFELKEEGDGDYLLTISKVESQTTNTKNNDEDIVIFISSDKIGEGADELGELLMSTLFKTIEDISIKPSKFIFMNTGVKLTSVNKDTVKSLKKIEESGIEIINCGTCLDFYEIKDKLKIGRVSNFFEILEILTGADRVISL